MRGNDNKNKGVQKKQKTGCFVRTANNESVCDSSFGGPEVSWVTLCLWERVTSETNKKKSCLGANRGSSEVVPELRSEARSGFN